MSASGQIKPFIRHSAGERLDRSPHEKWRSSDRPARRPATARPTDATT